MPRYRIVNATPACLQANVGLTLGACCTTYAELLDTSGNTWIVFSTYTGGGCGSDDGQCCSNPTGIAVICNDLTVGQHQQQWLECLNCDDTDNGTNGLCGWLAGLEAQSVFGGDAQVVQVGVLDGVCTGYGADLTLVECLTTQPGCPPGSAIFPDGSCRPVDPPLPLASDGNGFASPTGPFALPVHPAVSQANISATCGNCATSMAETESEIEEYEDV